MNQKRFFWYSDDEDDDRTLSVEELLSTVVSQRLYIENGEPIRFRVDSIDWQDIRPEPPVIQEPGAEVKEETEGEGKKDPFHSAGFRILVSPLHVSHVSELIRISVHDCYEGRVLIVQGTIAESGLGLVNWWEPQEEAEDEEMEE